MRWASGAVASALVGILLGASQPAYSQYFGRNKVQYKSLAFEVLKTKHFDVYFYPEERAAAAQAAQMAERWYVRLARIFTHDLTTRQPLILYGSHTDFEQTNAIPGELGEGTGGVTESVKRRIVLPLGGSIGESDHVIGHELVHAFQYDMADLGGAHPMATNQGIERLPLWFIEGMAEYLSLGPQDPNTAMWMRDAASQEKMPTIHDLANPKYFPYRWGQALWAYVTGRWGDTVVSPLFRTAMSAGDAEAALSVVLGLKIDELSKQWQQALRDAALAVRQKTRRPADLAKPLERDANDLASYNVSPSLSPDGRQLMFLSQRGFISIDLYLAEAQTGKVLRKVVNTAVDPHFSSLEFINSAGAWSPDGRRFAFSAVQGGKATLVLIDVAAGRTDQEVPFPDLGQIFSPTFSPDGQAIAFSALQGGWTDLFIYDLRSKKTRRLTHDAFADLQPAWSPDGASIAFVSDRFTTRLGDLAAGNYQLVVMDVASGKMRQVEGATAGKNINPQWTRDGGLFFVSDRTGISNVYRVDQASGAARLVTNIATGVSGITALSPAISFAPAAGKLALSIYENNKFDIYSIDAPQVLAGELPPPSLVAEIPGPATAAAPQPAGIVIDPARLPPATRKSNEWTSLQSDPNAGLANARNASTSRYDPKLSLDLIGQPYVSAGVDAYGMFAGGGMSLFWSDMLGDYNLGAAVQVASAFGGGLTDLGRSFGGQVVFENRKHRWNYGLGAGQVPFLSAIFSSRVAAQPDGTAIGVDQTTIYRQVERSVNAVTAYPFNTAQRLEFSGGLTNISFDQQVQTTTFDLGSGAVLTDERQTLPAGSPLTLGQFSAALVYDTAAYGATSPISGQSYRLQVAPTVGTVHFNSVLADYRRYVMPVPFYTIAGRILHFGRYGSDAQDPRLVPLYLGYPNLVRGYDFNSFGPGDCTPSATSSCQEFDRLLGSRMLVANLEFRFPLLRPLGISQGMYGKLPLELAFFADGGVAWNAGEKPKIFGGQREAVTSAGVALRANIFGAFVAEFDFSKPFQRRGQGWVFQFNISPGF